MKKFTLTALWTAMLTALAAVTVYADLIPMEPGPVMPEPEPGPVPTQPDTALLTVLIVGVAVIAAAVAAWLIIRRRRTK